MSILEKASQLQQEAWSIIEDTQVVQCWTSIGATINLVGSLKTGLLVKNRDIDFHIYTDPFKLSDSFSAISKLAENDRVRTISYTNLLDAEDKCIEWHALYEAKNGQTWQIDMIHIVKDSPYAGYFENVAERISSVLTQETREAILRIKDAIPTDKKVMSIQVYQAVIEGGIRDLEGFEHWMTQHPDDGIITWIP